MKKLFVITAVFFAMAASVVAQDKSNLDIEISGISEIKGNVLIALYNTSDSFLKAPVDKRIVKVSGDRVEVSFEGLESGVYAFSLFHDVNENKELDKGMFGIPSEPYAFSNNASGFMGPASFEDSSFKVEGTEVKQIIKLN